MFVVYFHSAIRDALGISGWVVFGLHFDNGWQWMDGSPVTDAEINWSPGEPDNDGECAVMLLNPAQNKYDRLTFETGCTGTRASLCQYECS